MGTILLIILIIIVLGALPVYPYSGGWATTQAAARASC